ncbi:RepB family plasmid replication initiator protein, partial [Campylobacter coli]|nr:RepB family plasmid replication initiator protein [Campylobacter coli]EGP2583078.1 replication initiation protein [Campylobacter coli]EGU0621222.1 replication initiation protein [Campylobacter coli]EHP2175345.1 replication initiation protein [Campylobacter coli]EIX7850289.1 replication initiation protein [Campylobacter coli]
MSEIVKYNNDFNLLPMPELKAIQMDMFMAIISLTKDKKENTPFLKKFFNPDKRKIIIPQKKFIELCRLNDSKMDYKEIFFAIDDCLKKLCNFLISYQKDERTIYNFVCFEEANIIADEVHITLQSRFYDMIINKKFGFTAFELAEFAELSGKYTKTLYRLLKQFRTTGKAYFEWEEFCRIMKIPENYRQIDIDQRILKPAIKELSKERNLFDQIRVPFKNLAYEKEKTAGRGRGGKVSGISFTFKPENIQMQKLENESQKIMSDEQKYLKILNNMKLNQVRFDYNDRFWQFNDFDFDEFKIIAVEL